MEKTVKLLFSLINHSLLGRPLSEEDKKPLNEEELSRLYALADKHDLAHLAGDALYKHQLLPKGSAAAARFQQAQVIALYRYTQMEHERKGIYRIFEEEKIPFVPLKGIIIRPLYPEPHLRTSCDIDILVHKEDLDRAVAALKRHLGYRLPEDAETFHDISLFSPSGVHLELHFTIENDQPFIDRLLSQVWEYCAPVAEGSFEYRQSNEFFMFHQVAHMVSHFLNGGCGIRPVADLALLRRRMTYDEATVVGMCDVCDIGIFYGHIKRLCDVWFGEAKQDTVTEKMQNFILHGGVYGNSDNSLSIKRSRKKSQGAYLLSRIFMPYRLLKTKYPVLKRHKWLYPAMTVRRWFELLSPAKRRRAVREMQKSGGVTQAEHNETAAFLAELGLS